MYREIYSISFLNKAILLSLRILYSLQNSFICLNICFHACKNCSWSSGWRLLFSSNSWVLYSYFYQIPPILGGVHSGLNFVTLASGVSWRLDSMHCEDLVNLFYDICIIFINHIIMIVPTIINCIIFMWMLGIIPNYPVINIDVVYCLLLTNMFLEVFLVICGTCPHFVGWSCWYFLDFFVFINIINFGGASSTESCFMPPLIIKITSFLLTDFNLPGECQTLIILR